MIGVGFALLFGLLAFMGRDRIWGLWPFFGGLLAISIFLQAGIDGQITVAWAYSNGFFAQTQPIEPLIRIPLFVSLIDFGITIWKALRR